MKYISKLIKVVIIIASLFLSNSVASAKKINTLNINNLMGLDTSSTNINIADNHCTDINNMLRINNTLQKRGRFRQLISGYKIRGMWKVGNYTLFHIENKLYYKIGWNEEYINLDELTEITYGEELINDMQGFTANDRIYLIGNKYLVFKTTTNALTKVSDDEDTYIPTLYRNVNYIGGVSAIQTQNYEKDNVASNYFKISLSTYVEDESKCNNYDTTNEKEYSIIYDYDLVPTQSKEIGKGVITFVDNKGNIQVANIKIDIDHIHFQTNLLVKTSDLGSHTLTRGSNPNVVQVNGVEYLIIGYFWWVVENLGDKKATKLTLNYDFKQISPSDDSIELTFRKGNANIDNTIDKCTFGIIYGAGNNKNRLFLSGNNHFPNVDWHSAERNIYASDNDKDLQTNKDFTYFPNDCYCEYGTSNSRVMGYQIMGDGNLMVIKSPNNNEPTTYFRKGTYKEVQVQMGTQTITMFEDTYPMYNGNIGKGCIVENGLKNLNNDIVYLSDDGIYGISSTITASVLNSDYKSSYKRSMNIDSLLLKYIKDYEVADMTIYDNKLWLTFKKGEEYTTFIADGRYRYKTNENIDNEYNYEYFKIPNYKIGNYFQINNKLYVGNDKGLFVYEENEINGEYNDIEYYKTKLGDITIQYSNDPKDRYTYEFLLFLNKELDTKILNNKHTKKIKFENDCYSQMISLASFVKENNYYLITDNGNFHQYNLSLILMENDFTYISKTTSKRYKMNYYEENTNKVIFTNIETNLAEEVVLEDMYLIIPKEEELKFMEDGLGFLLYKDLRLISFTQSLTTTNTNIVNARIKFIEPIKCNYKTKQFNFGSGAYDKFLRMFSITNDSNIYTQVNMRIKTKGFDTDITTIGNNTSGTSGLGETYLNLFKADLTNGTFASNYTKDFKIRFNYIQFEFYNDGFDNCVIDNITLMYSIGYLRKGVN